MALALLPAQPTDERGGRAGRASSEHAAATVAARS